MRHACKRISVGLALLITGAIAFGAVVGTNPATKTSNSVGRPGEAKTPNAALKSPNFAAVSAVEESSAVRRFGKNHILILPAVSVDYRDDEGTRLRQAGLLIGPYRLTRNSVAAGGCSFDIQCDDCDPCTHDACQISPGGSLGSGTCTNTTLADGVEGGCSDGLCCNGLETCQAGACEAPGDGTGSFNLGLCEYPCSGGTVCNEDSGLCRLPCDGTNLCAITGGACTTSNDCPPQLGNYCLNCNDGVNCNGVETCVAGVCESGTNPCGPGALCGERDCSGPGTTICTTDSDCALQNLGLCIKPGPICFPGRCCNNSTSEPECTPRFKSTGICAGGSNHGGLCVSNPQCRVCVSGIKRGTPCTSNAECPGSTCGGPGICNFTLSCDSVGGQWFANDLGQPFPNGAMTCPTPPLADPPNDRTLCPKYSGGIAPLVNFETETAFNVGFISSGPCDHSEIGDDYQIENNSPIAMEKFRWLGGGGGRLLIEFYDEFGNLIEDVVTGEITGQFAVRSLQFLPPLTIPARGFVVISVATQFAPNGRTLVAFTDAVDEGINAASGIASLWLDGAASDVSLRECVGGTNDGAWCDPANAGDGKCIGGGGVCQTRNNIMAFEIEGLKAPAPTGACFERASGICTPNVMPWICASEGNSYQGDGSTCPGNCGLGACCHANGSCTYISEEACNGAGDVFNGFGTDCEPNCCVQPTITGADNCQGATIHAIPVPDPGEPPVVRTITGNNAGATGPDTCLQGAWNTAGGTYLTVDPGWWEAFEILECAMVRIDFCCSDPVMEPAWTVLWKGCPCDTQVYSAIDPNMPNEPAGKRGGPYCEDENLWSKFGPLEAGVYYVPIYSQPAGTHGQYQMHVTANACPIAACCDGTTCIETDQFGCAAIEEANFLAPPFRTIITPTCMETTCSTGSCCYAPDEPLCMDVIDGELVTESLCNTANGEYKGGARCAGCVCAAGSPPKSCNDDADCGAEGPCNCDGPQSQLQPSPCPACAIESTAHCQRQPGYDGAYLSDLCTSNCVSDPPATEFSLPGFRVADDFVASVGGSVTSVCVWGIYFNQLAGGSDCSATAQTDEFFVTIYNDVNGVPGTWLGTRPTTVVRKAESFVSGTRHIFQYHLALASGLPVVQGNTYWLQVVANTDESTPGSPGCDWMWTLSDPDQGADSGNQYVLQNKGDTYTFGDAQFDGDMAWCINLDNTVPPIPQAACCTCGGGVGSCSVQSLENCTNADGQWLSNEPDCIGVICRDHADAADTCVTDRVAVTSFSATPWNNFCTNTDGPPTAGTGGCSGLDFQNDLWFTYTAPCSCDLAIETCDSEGEIDTGLVIYTDHTGVCPCPTSAANEVVCDDDGCVFARAGSRIVLSVLEGECYTIRVAGKGGAKGSGVLHISGCYEESVPGGPIADPSPIIKTRFISFSSIFGQTGCGSGGDGRVGIARQADIVASRRAAIHRRCGDAVYEL